MKYCTVANSIGRSWPIWTSVVVCARNACALRPVDQFLSPYSGITMRRALRKRSLFAFVPTYLNKKVIFDGARCPFSTFCVSKVITTAHAHKSGVIFHFFQELSNKQKIKALRPKMTKIASRGSCLNEDNMQTEQAYKSKKFKAVIDFFFLVPC